MRRPGDACGQKAGARIQFARREPERGRAAGRSRRSCRSCRARRSDHPQVESRVLALLRDQHVGAAIAVKVARDVLLRGVRREGGARLEPQARRFEVRARAAQKPERGAAIARRDGHQIGTAVAVEIAEQKARVLETQRVGLTGGRGCLRIERHRVEIPRRGLIDARHFPDPDVEARPVLATLHVDGAVAARAAHVAVEGAVLPRVGPDGFRRRRPSILRGQERAAAGGGRAVLSPRQ